MWRRKASQPEKSLREQLVEACEKVRDQIAVMASTPSYSVDPTKISGGRLAIEALRNELTQLEEALASLGPDDA